MVREVSGDSGSKWQKPIQSRETPEPPDPRGPFDKKHAHEWLNNLKEYLQWGIAHWDKQDVQDRVNEMIGYWINGDIFNEENYGKSIETLREGLGISFKSEKFETLQDIANQLLNFPNIDDPDAQKAALQDMVNNINRIV